MQKKVLALAVAGLVSGAAFAQTTVTFGGIVDLGYTYSGSHSTDGVKSRNAIDDGGHDASRLWWKATEDLGNGLSVSAKQEIRIRADYRSSGVTTDSSVLELSGKSWGTIRAGNYGSVSDDINGFSETGMAWGNGALDMITNDTNYNVVGYVSPSFGGFKARANFSTNDQNKDDAAGNSDSNVRMYGVNAEYQGNGLKVGASYQRRAAADNIAFEKQTEWMLSAGYTFGQFSVGAGYDREKTVDTSVRTAWRVGAGMMVTPKDQVALSYTRVKTDRDNTSVDPKESGIGLSYSHTMSKRTNVYASYAHISQNDAAEVVSPRYNSLFKVGLRHQF